MDHSDEAYEPCHRFRRETPLRWLLIREAESQEFPFPWSSHCTLLADRFGCLREQSVVVDPMVGRDGSCDYVACARPPSQNPPSGFSATGSPGCSRWRAVKPWHGVSTLHKVVQTRIDSGDRTSRAGAADSVVSTYGPIAVVPRAGPRQASACSDAIQNTGRSRAASSRVAFAGPAASNAYAY